MGDPERRQESGQADRVLDSPDGICGAAQERVAGGDRRNQVRFRLEPAPEHDSERVAGLARECAEGAEQRLAREA